jgi:hypothetical protein
LLSWDFPLHEAAFQLELFFAHERFVVVPTSGYWPIESRSVKKVACK